MSGFNDMFSQLDQQTGNALAPPAPPPKPTGMQSMFDALDNDPKIRATSNLVAAQSVAPEHAAAALQASRATGIPQPAAEENLDQAKQSAQLKANVDTLDQNPNLANFVADNPLAARLAQDDFQKLGTLEQLTTALKTGVAGALMGNELGRQGSLKQAAGLVGADTPAIDQKITGLQGAMAAQPKLTGGMGFVQNFTGFLTGLVDNAIQGGGEGGAVGAGIGAGLGAAAGGVGALPGAMAGSVTGSVVGFNVDMARVAAGNAYLKMGQIRGADGQPLSEGGKQFGAIFTGAATYALGTYASKIESALASSTAESLAQQALAKAVQSPTFTQAVKSFAGNTSKGIAQGAGIMTAMEASGIIGEEIAKAASSGHFETNPQEIIDRLADAAINGALLLGTMHGAMHGLSLYGDMRSAQHAESQAAMFKNLLDGSTDAKLRERDLQGFQQFMQSQTDGTPVENLYLPADKVRELYQGARIDPSNMTADPLFGFVPDMAKQLQESAANGGGGDVVIRTSDFVTHLAGTPLAEHLLPDLRVGADAMSVNEAKAFQAEYQERIKAAVDQAGKGAEPDSTQKIADEVRAQAKAAGYPDALASRYGAIYAARYAARAERRGLGEDPFALYQKEAPKIQAGQDESHGSFNQADIAKIPTTGVPIDLHYGRNTESSKNFKVPEGMDVGQGLEPAGEYMNVDHRPLHAPDGRWEVGTVSFKNPLVLEHNGTGSTGWKKTLSDMFDGKTGKALTKAIKDAGYDGIITHDDHGLNESVNLSGTKTPRIGEQRNLVVQHNLTAENLLHAKKMGGIPVPSLAITKAEHALTSFGDITLLGDKDMADPKGYAKTKVFGADIYSPRYPRITYELPKAKLKAMRSLFAKGEEATGAKIDESELEGRGAEELKNSAAVMWQFLTERGIKPDVKVKEGFSKERLKRLKKFGFEKYFGNTDHQSLMRDDAFQKLVITEQNEAYKSAGLDDLVVDYEDAKVNDWSRLMALSRNPAYEMGKVGKDAEPDGYATRDALRQQIRGKLDSEFKKYVEKKFEDVGAKEKIFKGFNNNGDRKYTPHTLDSVVKILKDELRGGEGFNYGVGSLRAKFTPEFKSIEQIRNSKDRLMDKASFEAVKKEVDDELEGISDDLKLSLDQTIEVLEDAPKMGVSRAIDRAFTDYRKGAVADDAVKQRIAEYLTRLKNLPTEYFEAKILREVDPAEFKGAVVPHDVDPDALQYLKDRGITDIRTYQRGDEADRAKQIGGFSHLFFQDDGRARAARARAYDANPFRAFLGKHGISPEIASEFAPGMTERRKAMVQGYGPIFRKTGLSLDKLTERAAEEGFIEPGSTDASKVYELIQKAMRGERVVPMYAEGAAEHEMQARMDQQREFESEIQTDKEAAPPEDIQILVDNSDPDADIPWDDVASNVSEESALKSLGFTDDEIQTLLTERSSKTDEAAASDNESGAAAGSQAQGNTGRDGQQQAGGSSGLTGPRGSIQFSDGSAVISLFAKADSSTLIHESGHAWLEELVADGSSEDAPQQLKDDLATVREWLGNDGGDLTTDQHEQFARAAEAYLMEGKTPSVALARVFSRFKQWLTKLYRTVRALDTPINDDIRGVFDRLLATDAEIDEAKRSTGLEPNFKSKEDAGMTTAEWNAYTGAIDKANAQAESTLLDKMMARVRRQRTAEYKEERAKAVEAATTEVDARPDIQALTMLRSVKADAQKIRLSSADIESVYGKDGVAAMPKGTMAKDGVHPDYVAEMLGFNSGDELVKSLQALEKQQREIQAQEGEKRNIRKYLIDQAADQKMEPHSADMLDEQSIREEAQAAVHSESRAALLAQELRYLKRSAARALEERGKGRKAADQVKTEADWNAAEADLMAKLDKAQAVAAAEEKTGKASDKAQATIADLKQQIADLKMTDRWKDAEADLVRKMDTAKQADEQRRLRESVLVTKETLEAIGKQVDGILDNKTTEEIGTFGTYLRDERKAARLVQQAILKKDWAAAAAAKQRQLISHILYSKAKAASDVIDRGSANMKRLTDKKTFKSIEQEYTDQIQDLLRRFGFDSGRGDELQRALKGSLEDFVKTKSEESGIELSVDPALYTLSKDVKSLTYAQFKALDEAVRSMQEIGRGMKMIEVDGQLRDVEEVKAEIVAAIRELGERMKSDFYDPRDAGQLAAAREKLFGIFRGIDASLTKPEALFDQIDKGNAFGIMNRAIFRRLKEAQGREDAWHEVASKEMKDAVEAAGKDWAKHLSDVVPDEPGLINPETGRPMKLTRKRMISMALNWGNEGNRIKLAEGYKWNPSTIQQFLNKNMTKADWDFAQRVWKMFDSHKQDLDDLQRRVTGVGLDMVQADAFDTPHGRYEGGYYPIVYDAGKSYQAEAHAEKATEALFPSNYTRATTPKGSTISRVEGVKRPIQLSLDVAPWKIGQTIHDLAFREAIIDADRLLSSDSVKKAMDDVFGPEYRKMLRPWLKHIANSKNIDDAAISWMDKAISTARTNTVIVGIGFRLSTMFKHGFSALSNSFKEVGPEWMLKGTREFYAPGRLKENWDFITSKSAEMKYRMNAYDKDVTSKYNELLTDSAYTTFQKQAQHFGHLGVSYLDLGSAAPTWLGAYRKALSQGMEDKDAVYVADKTVRNAHGAQGITDTAQIQRTTGVANLVNMFYGFFNHIYNRQRTMFIQGAEGVRNTRAGDYKAASKNFSDVLATSFWYLAVPALVEAMAINGGPSEKKDEGWGEWASKAILAEIPAGIPVIRDIAKAAIEGRDYEVSPIAKAVTDVLHAGRDISDMVQGLDPKESMGKHIATAAGYIAGLPTAAPFTAGKFLWDINNGDADPQSIKDWYQGLTRGKVTQE